MSEDDYRAQLRYQVVVLDISREDFIGQLASATDRFLNREVFAAGVRRMRAARRRLPVRLITKVHTGAVVNVGDESHDLLCLRDDDGTGGGR